jgi:hypothetical protein
MTAFCLLVTQNDLIGEFVSASLDISLLTAPRLVTFGSNLTPKALRKIKQVGKKFEGNLLHGNKS